MKHLLIIGARGWGREVYAGLLQTQMYFNGELDVKGFLDSKTDAFEGLKGSYPPIICSPEDYEIQQDDVFFVALGEPKWRRYYAEMITQKGGKFISIISDHAYIVPTATIGNGTYVSRWTTISDNVTLGEHVMIHAFTTIGHDAKIGSYSSIESYCFIGGYAKIGVESTMHVRSQIVPHKKIGDKAVVGACSVVMRNINNEEHVFGNPAKRMEF